MPQFLLALCGIPASGKTTLAEAVLAQLTDDLRPATLISTDALRDDEYYRNFTPEREHAVRQKALRRAERTLDQGQSVIHDDTNYYASMRHELLVVAERMSVAFGVVYVTTPLAVALRWNRQRRRQVPEEVLRRIADRLDPPGLRYAWDRPIAAADLSVMGVDEAARLVVSGLRRLIETEERGRGRMMASSSRDERATSLDVATRRLVAAFIRDHPARSDPQRLSKLRREVLKTALRQGLSEAETLDILRRRLYEDGILRS